MIKTLKMLGLATVAAMSAVTPAQAATSTNVLVNLALQFTVYSPGPTNHSGVSTTTKIATGALTTQSFIAALGQDTSITSKPFSSKAILALETPVTVLDGVTIPSLGEPTVVVVDGANIVTIPSSVISATPISFISPTAVLDSISVSVSGHSAAVSESFLDAGSLSINLPGQWVLQLSGTATIAPDNVTVGKGKGAPIVQVYTGTTDLSGYGTMGAAGTPAIVTGKITETYLKTLVQ